MQRCLCLLRQHISHYSDGVNDHLINLNKVLDILAMSGLKLNKTKWAFMLSRSMGCITHRKRSKGFKKLLMGQMLAHEKSKSHDDHSMVKQSIHTSVGNFTI